MIDDVPNADAVVVPVGGAGLIAGIACAVKTLKPNTKVRLDRRENNTLYPVIAGCSHIKSSTPR
jgi:threonine dehydratase